MFVMRSVGRSEGQRISSSFARGSVVTKQSKWIESALLIANLPQVKLTPQSGSMLTHAVSSQPTQISRSPFRLAHLESRSRREFRD